MVTGASSGIGAAVARALAAAGMRVAGCARRVDRLRELAAEIASAGGELVPIEVDLRDTAAIERAFEHVRRAVGGVDVLVNNAGLGHQAPLLSGATEAWREMLEVNVLALCVCTREAIADMRRRGVDDGHVIHISSMSAYRVPPGSGIYAASKHAVRALTEGLRQELRTEGSRIRVSSISPGFVETEFAEIYHRSPERARETYSRYKVLEPGDIATAALYLLAQPAHVQIHDILMRPTEQPT